MISTLARDNSTFSARSFDSECTLDESFWAAVVALDAESWM